MANITRIGPVKLKKHDFYNCEDWNENYDIMDKGVSAKNHLHPSGGILNTPIASKDILGITQYATESDAGTVLVSNRTLTPRSFSTAIRTHVVKASAVSKGVAPLSSKAEAEKGIEEGSFVTPIRLKDALNAVVPSMVSGGVSGGVSQATESVLGIARLASQAIANGGNSREQNVTPKTLGTFVDAKISAIPPPPAPSEHITDWYPMPIGMVFPLMSTAESGDMNKGKMRFVKLTAGDSLNIGLLQDDPNPSRVDHRGVWLTKTLATVVDSGSPMFKKQIHMINTDKRYIRASVNAGASYGDAMRLIKGHGGWVAHDTVEKSSSNPFYEQYLGKKEWGSAGGYYNNYLRFDSSYAVPQRNEVVPNTIELEYYMRIR